MGTYVTPLHGTRRNGVRWDILCCVYFPTTKKKASCLDCTHTTHNFLKPNECFPHDENCGCGGRRGRERCGGGKTTYPSPGFWAKQKPKQHATNQETRSAFLNYREGPSGLSRFRGGAVESLRRIIHSLTWAACKEGQGELSESGPQDVGDNECVIFPGPGPTSPNATKHLKATASGPKLLLSSPSLDSQGCLLFFQTPKARTRQLPNTGFPQPHTSRASNTLPDGSGLRLIGEVPSSA